jgi:hypothetical protein
MWNTKTQILNNPMWNTKTQIINQIQCGIQKHKSYIESNVEYKNTNHI